MPIYLLHGEDTYSSSQKVKHWKTEFIKKYGDTSNIEILEGKNLNTTNFQTNLETMPFLSEKRLVIVTNFLKKAKKEENQKISKAIEKVPDFCILVFHEIDKFEKTSSLYKKIKKLGKIEEFAPLTPAQLTTHILNTAKKQNILISPKTANYLAIHCGNELWKVSTELEKLATYTNKKEITEPLIDEFVTPSLSASIFKLTDSISEKNAKTSLKTFEILEDSFEGLNRTFFMIVRHFRILIQVHELAQKKESQFSITKRLKQHPYVIQKTLAQSKNFDREKLKKIYAQLLQIDVNLKTGKIRSYQGDYSEYKLAIEKFIINCCK
ncbi:MAG: DNA polymerase III subunit delta [Candidatus Peregrinibacteria bacterium]